MTKYEYWYKPSSINEIVNASKLVAKLKGDGNKDQYKEEKEKLRNMSIYFLDKKNISTEHLKRFWETKKACGRKEKAEGRERFLEKRVAIGNCQPISSFFETVNCNELTLCNVNISPEDCKLLVTKVFDNVQRIVFENVIFENIEEIENVVAEYLMDKFYMKCEEIEFIHSNYDNKDLLKSWCRNMNWKVYVDNTYNQIKIVKKYTFLLFHSTLKFRLVVGCTLTCRN